MHELTRELLSACTLNSTRHSSNKLNDLCAVHICTLRSPYHLYGFIKWNKDYCVTRCTCCLWIYNYIRSSQIVRLGILPRT